MKTLRSISGFHGRLLGHDKQPIFISLDSPSIGERHRPRTRSTVTIWHLPDSILTTLLRGVHVKDLLSFRSVHPYFRNLIDNNSSLWTCVSFAEAWPSPSNARHFIRACECGNIEATIKLAVSCLYREGLTKDDISKVGHEAARYLCQVETLTPDIFPFFWIFIRPPWAPDGSCCKVQAFQNIKEMVDKTNNKDLAFGVALTLKLQRLSLHSTDKEEEKKYFQMAMDQNSAPAVFFSLLDTIQDEADTAKELERIRLLRQLAASNILEAKLNLVKSYIQGHCGGLSHNIARDYVHDFFGSSKPSKIHLAFSNGLTSDISRYILVDWLVEVVGMKDFSAHTLYLAVSMFDRFLQVRSVQRSQVQLLGVAAMVISSRFLGFDILTIREAAWLTDNSYTYHDVVRMMGELVAAVKGNIRVLTIQDYVKVLIAMAGESGYVAMLVEYIAMLCLLQSEMGQYSPAEIAASCLLLSRLLMDKENPWPKDLQEWTGFSQEYLGLCTFHIHKKCLLEGAEVSYRDTKLQAVKMRYADSNRFSVSNIEVIGHRELCRRLGVTQFINHGKNTKAIRFRNTDELIVSPRRGRRSKCLSLGDDIVDRNSTATPPIQAAYAIEEGVSGYEGDLEEDDSDEYMSEKSDVFFELNDESFISDIAEDSQDWDSELSLMEDESSPEDLDCSAISACSAEKSADSDSEVGSLACLSSLCQFGSKMNCHASRSSPSCCISNCSCQQSHVSTEASLVKVCQGDYPTEPLSRVIPVSPNLSSSWSPSSTVFKCSAKVLPSQDRSSSVQNGCTVACSFFSCDNRHSSYSTDCEVLSNKTLSHLRSSQKCIKTPSHKAKVINTNQLSSSHMECSLDLPSCSSSADLSPEQRFDAFFSSPASRSFYHAQTTQDGKGKRLCATPQHSFTRLTEDGRLQWSHKKCSFLSAAPDNWAISIPSDYIPVDPLNTIPCTPETGSDKFLHNHFTRSSSAFRTVPSISSLCNEGLSDIRLLGQQVSPSKKCKVESTRMALRSFMDTSCTPVDDRFSITMNSNSIMQCDSSGQKGVNHEFILKRKRKL